MFPSPAFALLGFLAVATSVVMKREPFVRLIPADVLRDYSNGCFAATQCKVFKANQTWDLKPFCGISRCMEVATKDGRTTLAEEVTDCGPIIDIPKSTGCQLLDDEFNATEAFPKCCPVYDCDEDAEIVYKTKVAKQAKAADRESPRSSGRT